MPKTAKAVKPDNDAAAPGHNSTDLAEKDRKVLFFINRTNYLKALATKKAADAAMKLVGKEIKADLGEHGLIQIKAYEAAQTPEGLEKLKALQEATRQAMRFAGVPINTQLDLLDDLAPLDERAFDAGEEAGLRGDALANPYNESTAPGIEFAKGWHAGQEALGAGIKKKQDAASTDELIKGDDDGEDPFDGAGPDFIDPAGEQAPIAAE